MVKDDQDRSRRQAARVSSALVIATVALAVVLSAGGFLTACWLLRPAEEAPSATPAASRAPQVEAGPCRDWPKPDVALVLSGEQFGYLQPCGCSEPQKGGLARRFNMMQTLRRRGWALVAVDLGDIAQRSGPQTLLKYKYSMQALQLLKYTGVGIGANEIAQQLFTVLGEFALNERSPRVLAANLKDKDAKFPEMVASTIVGGGNDSPLKVGFVGIVAPSVAKVSQDPDARFDPEGQVLPPALADLQKQGADIQVLLYQGSVDEAKACAKQFPQFQVILCLSKEEEPSGQPEQVGGTMIVSVGHKGRYVGIVGVYGGKPRGQPVQLRYELVALDPEYETPAGKDAENPIHALLQKYAEEVKQGNYLAQYAHQKGKYPEVQVEFPQATYVGSETCKKCHEAAYEIWAASPHPHAYETLVNKAKRPNLRQYDGECVVCHVTGFRYASGFTDEQHTPLLKGVGCESCHGPASLHVANHKDKKLRVVLNPWKRNAKNPQDLANRISDTCQKCHDLDNSVNFKFEKYWEEMKIKH
jgi:hypothetical protein